VESASGKLVRVDLSEQRTYVYQDGQLLWTFVVSTGLPGSNTWTGTFHVQNKLPNAYAANWDLQMPHWLGIYWAGSLQNGFHALPILSNGQRLWEGVLGQPVSYGCIVLGVEDAQHLYNWAEIGTEVNIVP
jgi:lipoprotein-anchoring transpeptidase ErfK/SrfK